MAVVMVQTELALPMTLIKPLFLLQAGGVQAKRFVMTKGRAMVYLDTLFKYNEVFQLPERPSLGARC